MSAAQISVRNLQRTVKVDLARLRRFARAALPVCLRHPGEAVSTLTSLPAIHVLLVSDQKIAELHARYSNIPGPTDVLTFQHGEIIISVQTAQRQAAEHDEEFTRELERYILHGLLHLAGWDDKTPRAARAMHALQERLLREL